MARYQLLRPPPVTVTRRRVRRQELVSSIAPPAPSGTAPPEAEEEEVEEGPESPDSPGSSGSESSVGGSSSESDSESEDEEEPPSPAESGAPASVSGAPAPSPTAAISSGVAASSGVPSITNPGDNAAGVPNATPIAEPTPSPSSSAFTLGPETTQQPSFAPNPTPGGINAAQPQITQSEVPDSPTSSTAESVTSTASGFTTSTRTSAPSSADAFSSQIKRPQPTSTMAPSSVGLPPQSAQSELAGNSEPQQTSRQEEPIMSKTAAVAATVLGVLGALALIVGAIIFLKHRKRKRARYNQPLSDDAFKPDNTGSLHAPETAHITSSISPFAHQQSSSINNHLTRSTERSNTLFGAAPYTRPETVSTERSLATPNPFADPPLNKAYDVLAGRPRSTTLTDRGSWVKNPFRDPASERFDPFGELKEKARRERVRYVEEARREREREVVRGFEEKERMGLEVPGRKGSGVTVEGVGVLDRSGGGRY